MKVKCTNCDTVLNIGVERLTTTILIACPKCQQHMKISQPSYQTKENAKSTQPTLKKTESPQKIEEVNILKNSSEILDVKENTAPAVSNKNHIYRILTLLIILIIFFFFLSQVNKNSGNSSSEDSTTKKCQGYGNQDCITKIRRLVTGSGKDIVGEQYQGNGKFQIQFIEYGRGTINATYVMDCDCEPLSLDLTPL